MESALEAFRLKVGRDATVATIFCGDFNSCPCFAAYEYVLSGCIRKDHPDWQIYSRTEPPPCSCNHKILNVVYEEDQQFEVRPDNTTGTEGTDSNVGLELRHGLHFSNVCGTTHATNITLGWTGVLDYIFIDSESLSTERVVPFPSAGQLTEHVALPSVNFPSDHLALVADLKWK